MGDELDLGGIFLRAAVNGDEQAAAVGNDVGVGEDLVFSDQESGADAAAETAGIPRCLIVGHLGGDLDAQHGLVNIRGQGRGLREQRRDGQHQQENGKDRRIMDLPADLTGGDGEAANEICGSGT